MTTNTQDRIDARTRSGVDMRVWWMVLLPIAGALIGAVAITALWAPRLPAEIANQWAAGQVTTVRSLIATIAIVAGPAAVGWTVLAGYLVFGETRSAWTRRTTTGAISAITVTVSLALLIIVAPSLTVVDPWLAADPGILPFLVAAGVGLAVGISSGIAVRGDVTPSEAASRPTRQEEDAPTRWERRFVSPAALALLASGIVLVVLAATGLLWWGAGIAGGVIGLVGLCATRWRVTIVGDAVVSTPVMGPGRIRIDRVTRAHAETARSPLGPLGWGVRLDAPGRVALALGAASSLHVSDDVGRSFEIAMPDADRAAAILNESL